MREERRQNRGGKEGYKGRENIRNEGRKEEK
jgi:hypothetical protein